MICYAVKFENHIKNKKKFIKQNISFLENQFFFYLWKHIFDES